ncbi:hypothetical protein ACFLV4_06430 [Chloroflexota bacterium]
MEGEWERPPISKFKGLRIDPEIADVVVALNEAGFITYGSCAGHNAYIGAGKEMGYFSIEGYRDKERIRRILEAYGLKSIRVEHRPNRSDGYLGEAVFVL